MCGTAALALGVALAGCAPTAPAAPSPTSATVPASPTLTPSPPSGPVLVPDGSAEDNLPLFTAVMQAVYDRDDATKGRRYIDALVKAGFDKSDMQVTNDKTSVGNEADSIQFSVLWGDECLIGQIGPSVPRPTATVVPELPSGGCLIGQTRPIDW